MTMFFALLAFVAAHAQPCPDPVPLIVQAWERYGQAELDAAAEPLDLAERALPCQERLISRDELLELFRLRALVALSADDPTAMTAALARAVAVDHRLVAAPPVKFGPELQDAWLTLSRAAAAQLITLSVQGTVPAFIDGRQVDAGGEARVAPGLHLVQIRRDGAVSSRVEGIRTDQTLVTLPLPPTRSGSPSPRPRPLARRQRPPVLVIATVASGAASAFVLASGARSEQSFLASAYRARAYEGCAIGQACYPEARRLAVTSDAARVNRAYGIGYGLAAITSGLLTVTISGLPRRAGDR